MATPSCPQCGSKRIWKDGLRRLADGSVIQRWLCRDCGYRFSDPSKTSKRKNLHSFYCRVGGWDDQPKNSAKAVQALKKLEKDLAAGLREATDKTNVNSELINFAWWLKKQGLSESTVLGKVKLLRILAKRGADLTDPESVKEVIARQDWSSGRKENAVYAYTSYLLYKGGKWDPPRYKRIRKLPFIPTEKEIDALIASCGPKMSAFLQLLKETGMRAGEAWKLKWTDLDWEAGTITVNAPEKGSEPRRFKLSSKCLAMIQRLPKKRQYIFGGYGLNGFARGFQRQRARAARKLGNPRLLQISFHTFRHWKATIEYHKTKDILHVMRLLGHKNIKNTLIYTQLVDFKDDEYVCKAARTVEEAQKLIEAGFEYVDTIDEVHLYRKRK